MLRAVDLRDDESEMKLDMPQHRASVLGSKRILLFKEMLLHIGYGDSAIADCMKEGFDLMGPIPPSGVFQTKATFASLHEDHVRATAAQTRTGIIHSARRESDDTVIGKVFSATMAEVKCGWLVGPMSVDNLPDDCSVTRRFGVHQGTHVVDGAQVPKVGIDAVVSGVALRIRVAKERGVCENLNMRTMDLRKAYKHLRRFCFVSPLLLTTFHLALGHGKNIAKHI